jgi:hypothetical protein
LSASGLGGLLSLALLARGALSVRRFLRAAFLIRALRGLRLGKSPGFFGPTRLGRL